MKKKISAKLSDIFEEIIHNKATAIILYGNAETGDSKVCITAESEADLFALMAATLSENRELIPIVLDAIAAIHRGVADDNIEPDVPAGFKLN